MRCRVLRAGAILLAVVCTAAVVSAEDIWVSIVEPSDGDSVVGDVEVVVEVVARAEISEVEFQLDGRPIGTLTQEPFRMKLDLGEKNTAHRFSVVARDVEGNEATHQVSTQPIAIAADYEVELQQLYVSVTREGERVLDLGREHFFVSDEGDAQELVTFARGDIPFTAVLLIDASASMYGEKIESATAGAASFIYGMNELDQAQVIVFSDQLLSITPITDAKAVLTAGLSGAEARGGTALLDHLFVALKLLEQRQGRRVLILLSDGIDTHSVLPLDHFSAIARRSNALTYWMRIVRENGQPAPGDEVRLSSAWKNPEEYRAQYDALTDAVIQSGGRIFSVASPTEIRPVFMRILEELREQYVLGYYPNNTEDDGRWHRVRVRVDARGVEVRAPRGYVDH
jgi:Ca-activated chloride channel family protein